MPSTIKPRRGTTAPTTGIVQNELVVDTTNKRVYIGNSSGSGDLIGSAPGGSDTHIQFNDSGNFSGDSGLTFNKTTDILTVGGEININGGSIKSTQASFSILPAVVNSLTVGLASTATTIGATAGTLTLNSPTVAGSNVTQLLYDTLTTTMRFARACTTVTIGATTGTTEIRNPTLRLGNTTSSVTTNTGSSNNLTLNPYGKILLSPQRDFMSGGSIPSLIVENTDIASGVVEISGGDLYLGRKTTDDSVFTPVNIIFEGATNNTAETTLTAEDPTTDRTITLPNLTGTVALVAGSDTQVLFNDGGSALGGDSGLTFSKTTETLSVGLTSTAGIINIKGRGELRLNDSDSSNYVSLRSASTVSTNLTLTLPTADGTSGQVLTTDGSGNLSFATASGSAGPTGPAGPAGDSTSDVHFLLFQAGII